MYEKISINTFKILFFLIPVGLVTGPFIPDMALTIMSLLFIILSIKKSLWKKYYDNSIVKLLLLLNLYLIALSLFSENILLSLKSSLFYFRFVIFSIAVWYLLDQVGRSFKKNYTIYLISLFIALSIDAIFQYWFGENIIGLKIPNPDRISGFFGDQLVLGSYQSRLLILIVGLYLSFKVLNTNLLIFNIFFLITSVSIFLSGERTSFALFILSTLLFFFISRFSIKFITTIFLSFLLIFLIAYSNKEIRYRFFIEPLHQSNIASEDLLNKYKPQLKEYFHEDEEIIIFSKEHTAHYKTAFKIFLDNPIVGVGPKMFRIRCSEKKYYSGDLSCTTHPHNFLLQILAETGLIGLIFYLIIICFVIKNIYKIFKQKHTEINYVKLSCLILIFINLFPFVPTGNIFNNWLSILFYFPLGFYLYSSYEEKLEI